MAVAGGRGRGGGHVRGSGRSRGGGRARDPGDQAPCWAELDATKVRNWPTYDGDDEAWKLNRPTVSLDHTSTPIEWFQLIITDELVDLNANNAVKYFHKQRGLARRCPSTSSAWSASTTTTTT